MKRTIMRLIALLVGAPLALAACGSSTAPAASATVQGANYSNALGGVVGASPAAPKAASADSGAGGTTKLASNALPSHRNAQVIRSAVLVLEVANLDQTLQRVQQVATAAGGYISSADIGSVPPNPVPYGVQGGQAGGAPSGPVAPGVSSVAMPPLPYAAPGQVVLRVPSDRLDAVIASLRGLGKLQGQQVSALDVTQQTADLSGLVAAKQEEQARLMDFLSKAQSVQDIVTLDQALSDVRSTLLQLQQEQAALTDQVSYGTVTLQLSTPAVTPVNPPAPWWSPVDWQPARVVVQTANAIVAVAAVLAQVVIAVALWLLALIPLALLGWLLWRVGRVRRLVARLRARS